MKFQLNGKNYLFKGLPFDNLKLVNDKELNHDLRMITEMHLIQWMNKEGAAHTLDFQLIETMEPALATFLFQYKQIFDQPTCLPPVRPYDHKIPLVDETQTISLSSYRYSPYQKLVIEQTVKEALAAGFIRPSSSPYSSLVLLVKKADGSWILVNVH